MAEGTSFKEVIGEVESDTLVPGKDVQRVIFCSGKIYYELAAERRKMIEEGGGGDGMLPGDAVAIVRLEQIAPFPFHAVAEEMEKYPNAQFLWTQEEPKNMGAWYFVQDRWVSLKEG